MSYLRDVCDVNRMDDKSSESVFGRLGMSIKDEEINFEVTEVIKHNTFRLFSHGERMGRCVVTTRICILR